MRAGFKHSRLTPCRPPPRPRGDFQVVRLTSLYRPPSPLSTPPHHPKGPSTEHREVLRLAVCTGLGFGDPLE